MLNAVLEETMFWEKDGVLESQAWHHITYSSFRSLLRLLSYPPLLSTAGWLRTDSHPKVYFDAKLPNCPLGFERDIYTLLYLKWRTNGDLLYSTGNSAQCYVAAWTGGEFEGEVDTSIGMAESLCCAPKTITILLIGFTPT